MTNDRIDRVEDYLNGNLSDEETLRFEKDLAQGELNNVFCETLFMRDLLKNLPPDEPPGTRELSHGFRVGPK